MVLKTAVGPDLHRRNCGGQVSHAHQVVGGAGHGKNPIHSTDSAMPHLPHQRNRLQPAETLLDSLSLSLAEGVTCVPRGAAINRAAAAPFEVLRYMRRHPQIPALGYKSLRVSLIRPQSSCRAQLRRREYSRLRGGVGARRSLRRSGGGWGRSAPGVATPHSVPGHPDGGRGRGPRRGCAG